MEVKNQITDQELLSYILGLADNSMILGQRLAELCGHGPILEQDIALTNISLDLIGEARSYYQYAAEIEGGNKTEDDYPFKRDVMDWTNLLLVELPNGDFAHTIVKQFFFDLYHYHLLNGLKASENDRLAAIASKSIKESTYHLKYSSEWMVRLGDGTVESNSRMTKAIDKLMPYFDEAFQPSEIEIKMANAGIGVDVSKLNQPCLKMLNDVCNKGSLEVPEVPYPQKGGKQGRHSEHLGFILSDLQFMQRTYPDSKW